MSLRIRLTRVVLGAAVFACMCVTSALAASAAPDDSINWSRGRQWLTVRGGYAKSQAAGAAVGNLGGGIGYSRFLTRRWAVGAYVHDDLLGRFGGAAEIEIPFTVEVVRHTHWGSAFHPYLGVGGGVFYHKFFRTGADATKTYGASYLTFGANSGIGGHKVLGLDLRVARVPKQDDDPVFRRYANPYPVTSLPPGTRLHELTGGSKTHWSAKVSFSLTR